MSMAKRAKAKDATNQQSPYYIISRGEDQGYVIVAGDDCVPEVLGYTESGNFDEDNMPPYLNWFLEHYSGVIEAGRNVKARRYAPAATATTAKVSIKPLITTHWHQTGPYNDLCPKRKDGGGTCLTGCVATAASQVLYYWRKDLTDVTLASTSSYEGGNGYATTAIPKGTPLMWEFMKTSYTGSEPADFRKSVATLLAVVGGYAHLDYGSSTAGHNDNCRGCFSNVFGINGGVENNKDWGEAYNNYSDERWADLLYSELINNRPVLYSGCNEKGEGHAVVVDGYDAAKGLFHFNLGWGGQGDGYFTVARAQAPSWGFNNSWQECVTQVYPKKQNVKADIRIAPKMYAASANDVSLTIKNNATLPVCSLYVFLNTTGKKPTSRSGYKFNDLTTEVPVDGSTEFKFKLTPTAGKKNYIYVTDYNLNVLATKEFDPVTSSPQLDVQSLCIDGSSDVEEMNGDKYDVVYNEKTTAFAQIYISSKSGIDDKLRMTFYKYNAETAEWEEVGVKSGNITGEGKTVAQAEFSLTSTSACPFDFGVYYKGVIGVASSSNYTINAPEESLSTVRFILKPSDLEIVSFENDVLTLKGHFDDTKFNSALISKKAAYKTTTLYDLTQCQGVKSIIQEVNPNALYYVSDESSAEGLNIVKNNKCKELQLTMGYNFTPRADFRAEKATLKIQAEVGRWILLTSPFNAQVPDGIIARDVQSHAAIGISNRTEDVKTLKAGQTYLVMITSQSNTTLFGYDTLVKATPQTSTDAAFIGTYTNTTTPELAMLIDDEENPYFAPVGEGSAVTAFGGYFLDEAIKSKFRANSSLTLDPAYASFASSIDEAYYLLDKYKNSSTDAAYADYLAKIHEAEKYFSNRTDSELSSSSKIKNYAAALIASADDYMVQVEPNAGDVEIDFTSFITNPSFEQKSTTGWTLGTAEGVTKAGTVKNGSQQTADITLKGDGLYFFQSKLTDGTSVELSQTVTNLLPGYYRLTAKLGTDEGNTLTLFANDSLCTQSVPKNANYYLQEFTIEDILVDAEHNATSNPDEGLTLTIGVKAGSWYKADDFRLTLIRSLEVPEDPTAIECIPSITSSTSAPSGIYTLQGVKVNSMNNPGIYVVNGRKVVK